MHLPYLRGVAASLIVLTACALAPSLASAEDAESTAPWFSITPRVWMSFVDTIDFDVLNKEVVFVPMAGGSVSITPPAVPGLGVIFTGLYGEGEGDAEFTDWSFDGAPFEFDAELERLDLELLLRYQIPDTPVSFFAGPRYVTFDEKYTYSGGIEIKNNADVIVAEFGVGAAGEVGERGRHRFFGNIMSGIAFVESTYRDNIYPTPKNKAHDADPFVDLNLGYQYIPTRWLTASIRYRLFVLFAEDDFGLSSLLSAQGPEVGVSIRF